MQEAKYSANFKKFRGETDVLFTVRSDETADQHLESVIQYFEACDARGFRDKAGSGVSGLAENEDSQIVNGYVIGRSNQNDGSTAYVVWMYGPRKHREIAVYPEDWNKLWFTPDTSKPWPVKQCPDAQEARSSGMFFNVPERVIVRYEYKNKEGELRRKFSRVAGTPGANGHAAAPQQPTSQPPAQDPEALAERFVAAVQTSVNTVDHLVNFGKTAIHRKAEFGSAWIRVNNVLKSKIATLRLTNNVSAMNEAVDKIREALGPLYDEVKRSLTPPPQTEFAAEDPDHGFVPF